MEIMFAVEDASPLARSVLRLIQHHLGRKTSARAPPWVPKLWAGLGAELRKELATLANRGRLSQADLLTSLKISATDLRGLHIALSRARKKLGVPYPIESRGTTASARQFWLLPEVANAIRILASKNP